LLYFGWDIGTGFFSDDKAKATNFELKKVSKLAKNVFHNQKLITTESSKHRFGCFGLLLDPL